MQDAFRCHLGRFPSVANGLNELEAATLVALRRGPRRFGELFQEVTALPHLRRHGMGDVQFAACLRGLMPLVSITGGDILTAEIDITAQGRRGRGRGGGLAGAASRSTPGWAASTCTTAGRSGAGTAPGAGW